MATDKKSFLIYCDIIHTVEQLTNEQAGDLFKHLLRYVNDLNPQSDNVITKIAFEPIKQALKRDLDKYESIRKRNSDNGSKGGRPNKPKETQTTHPFPKKPKKADSDSGSDIVIDSVKQEYKLAFDLWVQYKKEKKQKYTPTGIAQLIKSVETKYTPKQFTEVVENSICQNYAGLIPPKEYQNNTNTPQIINRKVFSLEDYDNRT